MKAYLRKTLRVYLAAAVCTVVALGFSATELRADPRVVTELDATEPFEAMAFHGGVLWVGNSRNMMSAEYRLKVFSADGALVASEVFPHSQTFIYPYNDRSVLIVGVKPQPNLTHYSIVTYNGPNRPLTVRTKQVPAEAWAYHWIGTAGSKEFFIDMGGLVDDPERDQNPNLPARTIFSMQAGYPTYSPARVRMPIQGIKVGSDFFVLHRLAIGAPQSGLVRVSSANFSVQSMFPDWRNMVTAIEYVPAVGLIAAAEAGADQVVLVNPATNAIAGTYPVAGRPRSVAAVGHCVAVGSEETKKIALINLRGEPDVIDTVDLAPVGDVFKGIRKVAVDAASGTVFARSSYACNVMAENCQQTHNSIVAAKMNMGACLE